MAKSLENQITGHLAELADIKKQLSQLETLQNSILTKITDYEAQDTVHGQLLLMSKVRLENLENAVKDNLLASRTLGEEIEGFQNDINAKSISFQKTSDQIELTQKQIADIRQSQLSDAEKQQVDAAIEKLLQVLKEKKQLEDRYLKINRDLLGQIELAQEAKKTIGGKLMAQLKRLKETRIIERLNYQDINGKVLKEDLFFLWDRISAVFKLATWKALLEQITKSGFFPWFIFLGSLTIIIFARRHYRSMLKQIEEKCEGPHQYYRWLCIFILRRSLPYLLITLILGLYSSVQFSLLDVELGRILFYIALVLLVTRWGLDYLKHGFRNPPTVLRSFVSLHLINFFRIFRTAIIVFLILLWIVERDSLMAWIARTGVSAGFLAWAAIFWRQLGPVVVEGVRLGQSAPNQKRIAIARGLTYLVFGGNLMLNLLGYGILSGLWFGAWIEMVTLLFWAGISLNALHELHRDLRLQTVAADEDNPLTLTHYWRWALIQLARAVWFVGLVAGMLWIGDPSGYLRLQIGQFFNFTVTLGSLNLSIKGIVLAIVIIFITHLASRVGRALLKEKVLDKRSLERGLKDSILTITSYLGWGLGLLLALGSFGVDSTSLAVVFGALSIGIGFGLQNIFNNFISGLILLFERPIQVGDYVEVGGLWAEIKKINVRATVVQTFDNASLIIPNSEFISQQVTNWSFKDKRMRRNIDIGVAYGSDIDLVQKTLLDIARETREILKYPQPDVLFMDHADSALIFRLRIWVNIDDSLRVASQVRCDIDWRFRELGIEIAFPQRDLHIRTIPKELASVVSTRDSDSTLTCSQKNP